MIRNKIILITGGSSGIGAETAKRLALRGAIPIITGRNENRLKEMSAEIEGRHGIYRMDVTCYDEVLQITQRIQQEFGAIDVLLNNAGFGLFESFVDGEVEHFASMMDTNYMGMVRCAKAVLPYMQKRGSGHIINVASMAGKISTAKASGYAATKHAVLGLTNAMRTELAPMGITVSAINPGPIDTPFLKSADPEGTYFDSVRGFMLTPERVAAAIVRMIERKTPEVDLPLSAAIGIRIYGLFPRFADRIAGRWLNRK
ncbi:SDR family NAD(P)-dependent oxidoreductase [Paenibacillus nasutitermitis]|uniref:Oxidoreductase n=1 Tax=Paenibacillus nasutitermitis TaxID=1652958 RepID=A0A916YLC6_9BACL|nr:SDR family oxidoreductase [Paenibacillus nasutitermitis]GGD49384.1 oxidoreductase [Paenibacillus nasutitermitis]